MMTVERPASVDATMALLAKADYVCDRRLATTLFLSLRLQRPLFLEGEAGVGKTELARVLASTLDAPLIRLQCYEGLDMAQAAYEWNAARQMIEIRLAEANGTHDREALAGEIFSEKFLIERPLLRAIRSPVPAVLLIDELDRADEPFEAFLLEVLSDFAMTIPELGTLRAAHPPMVVITSNRTREIHDALKRRCLYHWVDYPDVYREYDIVRRKARGASEDLAQQVVAYVQKMRTMDLFKVPGVAETIDWTNALVALNRMALDPESVQDTLGVLLKYQDDIQRMQGTEAAAVLDQIKAAVGKGL